MSLLLALLSTDAETSAPVGDYGRKRRKRKHYDNLFDTISDVLAQEEQRVEALPEPPKPTQKRKKTIARQIVIAAGKTDLLPIIAAHKEEAIEIGATAIEATQAPSPQEAQARYQEIVRLIAELQRIADEEDEDETEFLLLAA